MVDWRHGSWRRRTDRTRRSSPAAAGDSRSASASLAATDGNCVPVPRTRGFLTCTHGRIKKRALLTTRCKRASRWATVQPMNWSRGATFQAQAANPSTAKHLLPAAHQIAQLCACQRGIAEVMVAVHVFAPERRIGLVGERLHAQFRQLMHAAGERLLGLCLPWERGGARRSAGGSGTCARAPRRTMIALMGESMTRKRDGAEFNPQFQVGLDVAGRRCLVIGGGAEATKGGTGAGTRLMDVRARFTQPSAAAASTKRRASPDRTGPAGSTCRDAPPSTPPARSAPSSSASATGSTCFVRRTQPTR